MPDATSSNSRMPMATQRPALHLVLERRLDLFALDGVTLHRAASYDRGTTWREWHQLPGLPAFAFGAYAPAVAGAADGGLTHLLVRRDDALGDRGIFHARSGDHFGSWDVVWREIGNGTFTSSPAAACSGDGQRLYVCARGTDDRCWMAASDDGGTSWRYAWAAIGAGVFRSAPAVAASADGRTVLVAGRGMDDRLWLARSRDAAASWELAWGAVGTGVFNSSPALCLSADGSRCFLFARGMDDRCWWNRSSDFGQSWRGWAAIPNGVLITGPTAAVGWDGQSVSVVGMGTDRRPWWAASSNAGDGWQTAWSAVPGRTFS